MKKVEQIYTTVNHVCLNVVREDEECGWTKGKLQQWCGQLWYARQWSEKPVHKFCLGFAWGNRTSSAEGNRTVTAGRRLKVNKIQHWFSEENYVGMNIWTYFVNSEEKKNLVLWKKSFSDKDLFNFINLVISLTAELCIIICKMKCKYQTYNLL